MKNAISKVGIISKVGKHGQTAIPKEIREKLGVKEGDYILWRARVGAVVVERVKLEESAEHGK